MQVYVTPPRTKRTGVHRKRRFPEALAVAATFEPSTRVLAVSLINPHSGGAVRVSLLVFDAEYRRATTAFEPFLDMQGDELVDTSFSIKPTAPMPCLLLPACSSAAGSSTTGTSKACSLTGLHAPGLILVCACTQQRCSAEQQELDLNCHHHRKYLFCIMD